MRHLPAPALTFGVLDVMSTDSKLEHTSFLHGLRVLKELVLTLWDWLWNAS